MLKKFVLLSVLLFAFALPVFVQEDSSDLEEFQKMALELSNKQSNSSSESLSSNQSSATESTSATSSTSSSEELNLESMNPFQLLDQLDLMYQQALNSLTEAQKLSKSLEEDLSNTMQELQNSKITLENLKTALMSNKEDVSIAIQEMGILYEQLKLLNEKSTSYKKRFKRSFILGNILIPTTTLPLVVSGSILLAADNAYGKPVLFTGLGLLAGCEVVWNGGHFIFKFW